MQQKFDGVQALRGIAALLVAGFHLAVASRASGYDPGLFRAFDRGEFGVDLFFVISGFIIYHAAIPVAGRSGSAFVIARFWRILPPHWAILLLYIAASLAFAAAGEGNDRLPSAWSVLVSALLLPFPEQIIVAASTLSIEILFYALFALTFFRFGRAGLLTAMTIWVGASQIHAFFTLTPHPGPGLLLGTESANSFMESLSPSRSNAARCALQVLGDASYLLYLFHLLVFLAVDRLIRAAWGLEPYASPTAMLGMLVLAVFIALALNRWLERPYRVWYHRRLSRDRLGQDGSETTPPPGCAAVT